MTTDKSSGFPNLSENQALPFHSSISDTNSSAGGKRVNVDNLDITSSLGILQINSVLQDGSPFDLRNQQHIRLLLQATSTEDQIRGLIERSNHKNSSSEEKQRIVDDYFKRMIEIDALDPRVLRFSGRAFESHRNAARAYLESLVGVTPQGADDSRPLGQDIQNFHVEPLIALPARLPSLGWEAPVAQEPGNSAIYRPRWKYIECLGKGGFGSVWSCENLLDGEIYAIKKIIITDQFLNFVQLADDTEREKAFTEMHHEVRVLARLDHPNIVRYYGSWMERISREQFERVKKDLCPQGMEDYTEAWSSKASFDRLATESSVDEIEGSEDSEKYKPRIFHRNYMEDGDDDESENEDESESESESESENEVESEGEISDEAESEDENETAAEEISENKNKNIEDTTEGEDDVSDSFQFDLDAVPLSKITTLLDARRIYNPEVSFSGGSIFERSVGSTKSNSSAELEVVQRGSSQLTLLKPSEQPNVHILSIQMAKYSLSLNDFIKTPTGDDTSTKEFDFEYHFQPKIAIELMLRIVDAVEYMHHYNLVHRDLKPANIFLKVEKGSIGDINGSVRVSGCKCSYRKQPCPQAGGCLPGELCWVTPKIGDFGLTADIKRAMETKKGGEGLSEMAQGPSGPGTSTYMPPPWAENTRDIGASVRSQKDDLHLGDAYALGIILFELLQPFGTSVQRLIEIGKLRESDRSVDPFPRDFCSDYISTLGSKHLATLKSLILCLTCERQSRMGVSDLKEELLKLLPFL